jgi:hypothetical protein
MLCMRLCTCEPSPEAQGSSPEEPKDLPKDPGSEDDLGHDVESDVDVELVEAGWEPEHRVISSPILI